MKKSKLIVLIGSVLILCAFAHAGVSVNPTSYDMVNGYSGQYNYWDDTYDGIGDNTANGSLLTGGLGDLTDGVIASGNWFDVEGPIGPNGPYVGWLRIDPIITFNFSSTQNFESVHIHFDDSNGNGGVSAPVGVGINGTLYNISDPAGSAPFWTNIDVSGQSLNTDTLVVTLRRGNAWVFASEVDFVATGGDVTTRGTGVPAPGAFLLTCLGASLVGYMRQHKNI